MRAIPQTRQLLRIHQRRLRTAGVFILIATLVLWGLYAVLGASPTAFAQTTDECTNLMADSSFESDEAWATRTNGTYAVLSNYQYHGGARSAYLAGVDNAQDSVSTTLILPSAEALTLSFWSLVETTEAGTGADRATVIIADASGAPLETIAALSDLDADDGETWQRTSVDLSAYAGQTVHLQFQAETDASQETDFYFDDVTLTTCALQSVNGFSIFLPFSRR